MNRRVGNDGKYQVYFMKKRKIILLVLLYILVLAFLVAPVAAGLTIADGLTVTTPNGATSPVINITNPEIAPGGTITIDVSMLKWYFASWRKSVV